MTLARVDGVIVSTVCHPSMTGHRMIICQPLDGRGAEEGAPILALDPFGAGRHQRVLISSDGSHTRAHVKHVHRMCMTAEARQNTAEARVRELEAWGALMDRTPDGRILQDAADAPEGTEIEARLARGSLVARVTRKPG